MTPGLLADTQILLRMRTEPEILRSAELRAIESAQVRYVSAVTLWEFEILIELEPGHNSFVHPSPLGSQRRTRSPPGEAVGRKPNFSRRAAAFDRFCGGIMAITGTRRASTLATRAANTP